MLNDESLRLRFNFKEEWLSSSFFLIWCHQLLFYRKMKWHRCTSQNCGRKYFTWKYFVSFGGYSTFQLKLYYCFITVKTYARVLNSTNVTLLYWWHRVIWPKISHLSRIIAGSIRPVLRTANLNSSFIAIVCEYSCSKFL